MSSLEDKLGDAKGLEFRGPWGDRETVIAAILAAGEKVKPYREGLTDKSFEAVSSLGGSFRSDNIEDCCLTPWDLDYGRIIKSDHDIIGREALEKMAGDLHRTKVTLVWDKDSCLQLFPGFVDGEGLMPKFHGSACRTICDPSVRPGRDRRQALRLLDRPPRTKGLGCLLLCQRARRRTSAPHSGGKPNGGTRKPTVERHRQIKIAAEVNPWPMHAAYRLQYRKTA